MASVARLPYVSLDTYLHHTGDLQPDMDWVDGVLEERNMGETEHGDLQGILYAYLRQRRHEWQAKPFPETRVQVGPARFRVPDICVMPLSWRKVPIIRTVPLLCIEVLSEGDTLSRQRQRCEDYIRMGVPEVWIFDPLERVAYVQRNDSFLEQREGVLQLAGTPIALPLAEIFAELDE